MSPSDGPATEADGSSSRDAVDELKQVTDSSLSYLSLEALLGQLLERIKEILAADTAAILLVDRDRGVLVARAARGIEEEVRQGVQIPLGRGLAGRIATERRPIVVEDTGRADIDIVNPLLRQRGIQSMLGVPLLVEGRVIGVLHVGTLHPRQFTDEDAHLLQVAADRAALAIDNAQLSEQRALTEVLQRTLLPEALPQVPGLRFSAKYLPAAAGLKVGGDWYDVFTLDDGRIAFVTGDVVGRGIGAATVMAEVRTAVRAYALERPDPLAVMTLLNTLLLSMGRRRSATLQLMALDIEAGRITAVNAGHPPALMLDRDGECRFVVQAGGPPLGVSWSARYSAAEIAFRPGDALVLYTDGVIERRGETIDDGMRRLASSVTGADRDRSAPLAEVVVSRILLETTLEDDVALLAIECLPLEDRMSFSLEAGPAVLTGLRRAAGRWLSAQGLSDRAVFDLALALSEAAANAIEHAYGPADAAFDVDFCASPEEIAITVTDHGAWRERGEPERGRGMEIMAKLVDELDVQRTPQGTKVRLCLRRPA